MLRHPALTRKLTMSKRHKFNHANKRARTYHATIALRAIVLGLVVTPLFVLGLHWIGRPVQQAAPPQTVTVRSDFAMNSSPEDLSKIFKDVALTTETRFVERDRVVNMLTKMRNEYKDGTIHNLGQLDQALVDYLSTLNDRYAAVISTQQYVDFMVGFSGQEVGVELNFTNDSTTGNWVVQHMAKDGPAEQAGIQVGDMLVSIENYHVEELKKIGNVAELAKFLLSQAGVLGSKAKITLRRGADVYDFEVERTIIKTHPAISFPAENGSLMDEEAMMHGYPESLGSSLGGEFVKIHFMDGDNFFSEFEGAVNKLVEDGVPGIVLDLSDVAGGNGDLAVRVAALFIESGNIAHCIKNVEGDAIEMHTYTAREGKVFVTVRGPYRKNADGQLVANQDVKETEQPLNWKSGVFKGEVVVGVNGGTQGAAELLAGALQRNRQSHVVGTDVTFGKGMTVTYFPVSPDRVVRFSTAVYLLPDGASIEKRGLMPNIGVAEHEYNRALIEVLDQRLRIVPFPVGPAKPEKK